MAMSAETVTTAKVALSHVLLAVNGTGNSSNSPYSQNIGRVIDVGDIALGKELYEHRGYNADGTSQIVHLFETALRDGKLDVTIDEVHDWDSAGETYWGEQLDITLTAVYQDNSTKGWQYAIPKGYVNREAFKPNTGDPCTARLMITPYNSPGTAPYTFDDDYTV